MTETMIDLPEAIAKCDDADFLRELIQDAAQRLMDIEASAVRPDHEPHRAGRACDVCRHEPHHRRAKRAPARRRVDRGFGDAEARRARKDACRLINGAMNRDLFEFYVETQLAPTMHPGDVIILDTLSSHKSPKASDIMRAVGAWFRCSGNIAHRTLF